MGHSLISYNPTLAKQIIRSPERYSIEQYLSPACSPELIKTYDRLFGTHLNGPIDRTGQLPSYLNVKVTEPIPSIDNFDMSFEAVCEQRAKELGALGEYINVLWSGGLDSTFTIFCLLQHLPADQIRVVGTYASIIESGDLFDNHIKNRVECNIGVIDRDIFVGPQELYVSGILGNQVFGAGNIFGNKFPANFGSLSTIHKDYTKHIPEDILEMLDPVIKAFPRKIETVEDFRWFIMFNFTWQAMKWEINTNLTDDYFGRVLGFFDHDNFQKWALTSKDPWQLDPANNLTHRWQMRDLLDRWLGPNNYARQKDKSLSILFAKRKTWFAILDNYTNIHFEGR